MYIRNKDGFVNSFWDWSILDGCFGDTRIRPMDCEGIVERKGHFLYLETKKPSEDTPKGQRLTLEALARTGLFTVMIIWGQLNKPEQLEVLVQAGTKGPFACDLDALRAHVVRWFNWADGGSTYGTTH